MVKSHKSITTIKETSLSGEDYLLEAKTFSSH
jgi:hypothetical protein